VRRLVGINHVALEVGDVEEALAFYVAIAPARPPAQAPSRRALSFGELWNRDALQCDWAVE
jgi:catechol 2,3-dioxygenase-like lactoylglutathione lyase family enzyme